MSKILPWSFSALNKFITCPNQFYEVRVLKNYKDEPGEVALWGTYVHKCIEDFVMYETPFPDNVQAYVPQVLQALGDIKNQIFSAEVELALDKKIQPCEWKDGWVRGIIDFLKIDTEVAKAVDWKLGKVKPDSKQLKLFALLVFYHHPGVNTVYTSFEWLQFKTRTEQIYTRDQIPTLWGVFATDLQQYATAFKTDTWQKRPSGLCFGWCPVTGCSNWREKR